MRRLLRWIRRLVVGVLALALVGITVVLILLHTSWGRNFLRGRIEAAIQKPFPGSTIAWLTGSVLGTVTLHDVELVAGDGKPLAAVKELDVQLALLPLIGGTARIESATARGVTVHARKIPPPVDDGQPPTTWNVEIESFVVEDAIVILDDQGREITGVSIAGAASIRGAGPISAVAFVAATVEGRALAGGVVARVARVGKELVDATGFAWVTGAGGAVFASDLGLAARRATIVANVTAAEVAKLAPPRSVTGAARLRVELAGDRIVLSAAAGASSIDAVALVEVAARRVRGIASVADRRTEGTGRALIAGVLDGDRARATIVGRGDVAGYPGGDVVLAIDGALSTRTADVLVLAAGQGAARVGVVGRVAELDRTLSVERAIAGVEAGDVGVASGGRVPASGTVRVEATASGPVTALLVDGRFTATRVRYERLTAAAIAGTGHVQLGAALSYRAHADVRGLANAGKPIGAVTADVTSRPDGTLGVRARVRPAAVPIVAEASGVVTLGEVIDVALGAHRIDSRAGTWTGTGGRVRVTKTAIEVRGITTGQGDAWAKIDATIGRGTRALSAEIEARALPVAAIDPSFAGTASGTLTVSRARGTWTGHGVFAATGLVLAPAMKPVDGAVTVSLAGRRASVAVNASNAELGGARVALEVDGPADPTDVDAWMRVSRAELRSILVGVDHVDLAAATGGRTAGVVDGTLEITAGEPSGALFVRGVPTPAGRADADITLALQTAGFVDVSATTTVGEIGNANASVRLAIPDHPFDPRSWKALGARVVTAANVEAKDIPIDARLLALVGVEAPYHGTADVKLDLGAGASSATLTADVRGITGGAIVRGIDVHVGATADAQGTRAELQAVSSGITLVSLPDATIPVTLARWIADPRGALAAPLHGTLAIGEVAAPRVLAIVGRSDVTSGTIAGTIALGGTVGAPTAAGSLDITGVRVAPRFTTKPPPALTKLRVEGGWDGAAGHVLVTGAEEGGGTLRIEARGRPDAIASVVATAAIQKLDLAPIAPFLPGVLGGAGGLLASDLTLEGTKLHGWLGLTDGRVPLSPAIGTLRRANAKITIEESGALTGKLDGKLGAGSVTMTATSAGAETTIDAKLVKVSPIGALQPVIDATLHSVLRREGTRWTGTATLSKTTVLVPEQTGHELLDAVAPPDLIFVDLPIPQLPPAAAAPRDPWLVVALQVQPVLITVPEFAVDAMAGGKVTVSVGDTLGLDGELLVERGSADVFGHRYRVELGQLVFDGNTDGLLDLKLAHDFTDVTTYVRFAGRLSELPGKEPELTSDPGLYTRGQLLGFFLGGEPGGDPTKQTREAAAGFGAALASGQIGKRLKKYLPISLDVLRCDPGAGTSGASCTFGTWLTHEVFLAYKQKLEARYDENTGDASVEWHFKPSWVLEVSGGDRNYYGGDVLWRRRW